MSEFETDLQTCLDALATGQWDIDECLRRYPRHADQLRARLLAAAALQDAYGVQPSQEFARSSRERFLIATGQRLAEVYDNDPSPSFFAAARVKFLMTAHRLRIGERATKSRRVPLFGTPFRALASGMAAIALFMSLSTYTVASASDALPGEWQYGVKLQTERVRLALAFSEGAERDVRLDIAQERSQEIEQLAAKGRIIGPGVLERLKDQTEPLVRAANEGKLDRGETERLNEVTAQQRTVLAELEDHVAPEAAAQLAEAKTVSDEGYQVTFVQIVNDPQDPLPRVLTPVDPIETEDPSPTDTPEPTATPVDTATPGGANPTPPAPTSVPAETPEIGVGAEPVDTVFGVLWVRLSAGRLTTLIPSEKDGWRVMGVNSAVVQLSNVDGTSLVTINPRNGDMYWFILRAGLFDEVQMRLTKDGQTLVIDRPALRAAYGDAAEIPIFIMNRIELADPVVPQE
ncbi:MAG: DUF5667 domain-containing protein [Dehalococcoidia bacterium]